MEQKMYADSDWNYAFTQCLKNAKIVSLSKWVVILVLVDKIHKKTLIWINVQITEKP